MALVTMSHPNITGTAVVTVAAFNAVWDALGWEIVEPDAAAVYLPADMHYRGAWSASLVYAPGDVVSHLGVAWVALEPSFNDVPGTAPEWTPAATSADSPTIVNGGTP